MPACVLCLVYEGVSLHRFPNLKKNPEQFKLWVDAIGGKLESLYDYEYYKNKFICDIHFTQQDMNRNNRLNRLAVPTRHLRGITLGTPSSLTILEPSCKMSSTSPHASSETPSAELHLPDPPASDQDTPISDFDEILQSICFFYKWIC